MFDYTSARLTTKKTAAFYPGMTSTTGQVRALSRARGVAA
jgi:hypothetical protein